MEVEQKKPPSEISSIRSGSVWCWEPLKPEARCDVYISSLRWDGTEWWVETEALENAGRMWKGMKNWNEVSRFVEAAVLVTPAD